MPSIEAPATHVPSGVNLQDSTYALCSGKFTVTLAFYMSQSFTLLSSEQERSILWSGDILHYRTQFVWPIKDCLNFPSGFHIFMVLSEEQLTKKSSYLDKDSFNIDPEWAFTALFFPFLH